MESTKKKSIPGKMVTVVFSKEDGKRIRIAADIRAESMSKFVRTIVQERLKSMGYFNEDE